MINNFKTERDLLNYLMTSEFLDEELNPSELRELLFQFRHFYRSSHAKQESLSHQVDKLENKIDILSSKTNIMEADLTNKDVKYDHIINRELTVKERLLGKIFESDA